MNFGLRDYPSAYQRAVNGSIAFSKAGLAQAGIPAAGAAFKTANTVTYLINGIFPATKGATDNVGLSTTGPGGKPIFTQPVSSFVYYTILLDASGNFSSIQGDVNGAVPTASMLTAQTGTISGVSFTPYTVQSLQFPPAPGQSAILTPVGSYNVLTVTTSAAHNLQTGDTVQLNGILNSNLNNQGYVITVASSTTFTIDGLDPSFVGPAPGVNSGSTFTQLDAARACIGVIKIATSASATFLPGTTLITAAGITASYFDTPFLPMNPRP